MADGLPTDEQAAAVCLLGELRRGPAFAAVREHGSPLGALLARHGGGRGGGRRVRRMLSGARRAAGDLGVGITTYFDAAFPPLLKAVPDPPFALYTRGDAARLSAPAVALVGARRCTRTGAEIAERLGRMLAAAGLLVVSGLARGIDAAAHRGALESGVTAAVLGSGLGRVYPARHRALADAIVAGGGALVSEYPLRQPPARHQFPERNRLISGLAAGVVVVEAGTRSGSLITARLALEQGREVMAVPGTLASGLSAGCHRLLKDGAALVEGADDVLATLRELPTLAAAVPAALPPAVSPEHDHPEAGELARVLVHVDAADTTLDEIVRATGLDADVAAARLVELELLGFVRQTPAGYSRRPFGNADAWVSRT